MYKLENHACSGSSLWYSFEKFLTSHHKYNQVVFGYTSPYRIHVLPPDLAKWSFLKCGPGPADLSIPKEDAIRLKPVWDSMDIQYNEQFDLYIYQHIFNDVNSICKKNDIKLINLLPFEGYPSLPHLIDLSTATGPCITELAHVSDLGKKQIWMCHLSPHNNVHLATLIKELLTNDTNDIISITNNNKFLNDYENRFRH